jgi:hypothetical protein
MEFEETPLLRQLTGPEFRDAMKLADGLYPHQVEGVAFLLGRRLAILADDVGLAKRCRPAMRKTRTSEVPRELGSR